MDIRTLRSRRPARLLAVLSSVALLVGPGAAVTHAESTPAPTGLARVAGAQQSSVAFLSSEAGSGNQVQWELDLPNDPPLDVVPGRTWNFQLHSAIEFSMALCATQSYPEQVSTCTPDTDANITPLAQHPGAALLRLQFYPPGWVPLLAGGTSCDATRWCAAMVIDSLAEDPINGRDQNQTCMTLLGGSAEYENFAFITRSGRAQAPANPINATSATFTPDPNRDLFMSPGDHVRVRLVDSASGVQATVEDQTMKQTGSMVASGANAFGQVQFDPTGTSCTVQPYDFHPMYSTSSTSTRVPWAAQSFNIGFADDIGPWDNCSAMDPVSGNCTGVEGDAHANSNTENDAEPTDADDVDCFPASAALLVQVSGCAGTNAGFDGVPYHRSWPDGNTNLHPTALAFSSPRTGAGFRDRYSQAAIETNLPLYEYEMGTCDRSTGNGCSLIPLTDDGRPADFYPFFSIGGRGNACRWALGDRNPAFARSDFGGNYQYGSLLSQPYLAFGGHGATINVIDVYRNVLQANPC